MSARLIAAETGDELASQRESAKDVGDLIPAVDRLTKALRGRIGESLKAVRDAPRLDQVSTASIGALKSYAAGLRANDIQGDYAGAVQPFQEAIRQDSLFAMAYVQLSYSLQGRWADGRQSAESRLGDDGRVPAAEPAARSGSATMWKGAYYMTAGRTGEGDPVLPSAVELDSSNYDASNSLACLLSDRADFAGSRKHVSGWPSQVSHRTTPSSPTCPGYIDGAA
jgi:hypothetical protein